MLHTAGTIPSKRFYYLDNLKTFLTILVIVHHVGQAYGPTGGFWQYKSSLGENIPWLGSFFGVNAAFFMGLFFLIAGYFLPGSYDRKGGNMFLRDKLIRLGIPVVFAFFVLSPLEMYFYYSHYSGNPPLGFFNYYGRIYLGLGERPSWFRESIGWPELNFGHLWFVEHLLVYSLLYLAVRKLFPSLRLKKTGRRLRAGSLLLIAVLIAVLSAAVRIRYPIDRWVGLLGFIQSEVAHLPQYAILFAVGVAAFRKDWLAGIRSRTGYVCLAIGAAMAFVVYIRRLLPEDAADFLFSGWAVYESFMAVFLCFGLLVFFRERVNRLTPATAFLARNAYAAYIVHFPVVLFVQYRLDKFPLGGAWSKFLIVSILSVGLTFCLSALLRKLPVIRRIV